MKGSRLPGQLLGLLSCYIGCHVEVDASLEASEHWIILRHHRLLETRIEESGVAERGLTHREIDSLSAGKVREGLGIMVAHSTPGKSDRVQISALA